MAAFSSTFSIDQNGSQFQFKPYLGPPEKKPRPRKLNTNTTRAMADEFPDIDEVLGNGFDWGTSSEGALAFQSPEIKSAELSCSGFNADKEIDSQVKTGNVGRDNDFFVGDRPGRAARNQCDFPETSSTKLSTTDGTSPETALIIDDDSFSSDDSDNECHRLQECIAALAPEFSGEEGLSIGTEEITRETAIRSNTTPHRESTGDDALSLPNCDGKAKKTLIFAELVPLADDESDYAVRDGQTRRSPSRPLQSTGDETMPGCVLRSLKERTLGEQCETTKASDSDNSDDDEEDSDILPDRERKRSAPAETAKRPTFRGKPFTSPREPREDSSSDEYNEESGSDRRDLGPFERQQATSRLARKRKRGFQPCRSAAENATPLSTSISHGKGPMTDGTFPGCTSQQPISITIHPLSSTSASLTACFHGFNTIRSKQATRLVKGHLGHSTELSNITIECLTPGLWLLKCLQTNSSNTTSHQVHNVSKESWNDDDHSGRDHNRSSTDSEDDDGDSGLVYSTRRMAWSREEEERVIEWKKEGRDWNWMSSKLQSRSAGAVQIRWYTKLRWQ